jgi:hypothetical protein
MGMKATVIDKSPDGTLSLRAGIMNVTAKEDEVLLLENEQAPKQKSAPKGGGGELRSLSIKPEVDLRGMEAVEALSREALSDKALFDRPVRTDNEIYAPIEGGFSLTVRVPGASQEDVEVFMREMDVDIRIRNFMRSIPLPGVLRGAKMTSALVEDGTLTICFETKEVDG